jgi:hypothetical protein
MMSKVVIRDSTIDLDIFEAANALQLQSTKIRLLR